MKWGSCLSSRWPRWLQADDVQRIKLIVEKQDGAAWKTVDSALVFAAGDKLRFRVSSTFAGFLYVMNHGTSGAYDLLFPRADTGADNSIEVVVNTVGPGVCRDGSR